ncbi:MAG: hypothetical protein KTR28_01270 [Micavibrio sp.]|nr:hypothetical protein [Micavibrio sp.]
MKDAYEQKRGVVKNTVPRHILDLIPGYVEVYVKEKRKKWLGGFSE